jgi:hypothetical protein
VERKGKPGKNFLHACVGRTLLSADLEFAVEFAVYIGRNQKKKGTTEAVPFLIFSVTLCLRGKEA